MAFYWILKQIPCILTKKDLLSFSLLFILKRENILFLPSLLIQVHNRVHGSSKLKERKNVLKQNSQKPKSKSIWRNSTHTICTIQNWNEHKSTFFELPFFLNPTREFLLVFVSFFQQFFLSYFEFVVFGEELLWWHLKETLLAHCSQIIFKDRESQRNKIK